MALRPPPADGSAVPAPFVQPFLHALNRMRAQERLRPDQLTDRAALLLQERLGPARETVEAAFAHGSIGLVADHTHYFDGFALLVLLPHGAAVAARISASGETRIVTEASSDVTTIEVGGDLSTVTDPATRIAAESLVRVLDEEVPIELAIVTNLPSSVGAGRDAAISVATSRAIMALRALAISSEDLLMAEAAALEQATGGPFSNAFVQAAGITEEHAFVLVDTATREQITLDVPSTQRPGWAMIQTDTSAEWSAYCDPDRKARADDALAALVAHGFDGLDSFRDLQHRDLERATGAVPRRLRPVVQFLVTENARVQRMVAAIRRKDWQMLGALMLMSHASRRGDWKATSDRTDFLVEQAEQMSFEGIYGATQLGETGGTVLAVGLPFAIPPFVDRMATLHEDRYGAVPDAFLL